MRVLFDECVPRPLKRLLVGHQVFTAREMRWHTLKNGELLSRAEQQFDVFLTVLPRLQPLMPKVLAALEVIQPGAFVRIGAQPDPSWSTT